MKGYTEEQVTRARETDLVSYLERRGERFKREGKEYRWMTHDSVTICGNKWYRHSENKGGYSIDFVMEFYNLSFVEAVKELIGEEPAEGAVAAVSAQNKEKVPGHETENVTAVEDAGCPESSPIPTTELKLPEKNEDNAKAFEYLVKERGLDETIVNHFILKEQIYEEKQNHNVVFVGTDKAGKPRYGFMRGTQEKIRKDVTGSDKSYGFCHHGTSGQLYVFEAAIDLLSFLSLCQNKWEQHSYIALGGVSSKAMLHFLEQEKKISTILLCLDDDQAGNDACKKFLDVIPGNYIIHRLVPTAKDWNEVLQKKAEDPEIKPTKEFYLMRGSDTQKVNVMSIEDVEEQNVNWLWYPFIPFGKLTIIQGDPGLGKTWLAMQLVAACTNRQELPNMLPMEPFNVLYQTAEDGYGDTIKPRLRKCGADLSRVKFIVEDEKDLTMTDDRIERAIIENDVKLLILDPLQAYIGADININQSNETRAVLKKISRIAERTGCAIVVIGHLNKNGGSQSTYRGLGSIDIYAAARSVLLVGKVSKEKDLRVVLQLKDSLAPAETPVAFRIVDGKLVWAGEYEITAEQLMSGSEGTKKETKLGMAERILRKLLTERKLMYVSDLEERLVRQGISARTARDARSKIEKELEYGWDGNKKTVKLKASAEEKQE